MNAAQANTYPHFFNGLDFWELGIPGNFFRIMDSTEPITVVFYKNGSEIGRAENMKRGFWLDATTAGENFGFDRVHMESSIAQNVVISIAMARVGYDNGFVTVDTVGFINGGKIEVSNLPSNAPMQWKHKQVTVTNSASDILASDMNRTYLQIRNMHATGNVWLRFDNVDATATNACMKIAPNGSSQFTTVGGVPGFRVSAIGDIASNTEVLLMVGTNTLTPIP